MSIGVVREYAERLFACSPYTHRFFPRILRIRLKLSVHSETILSTANNPTIAVFSIYAEILSAHFPNTLRYFPEFFIGAKMLSAYPPNTQKEVIIHREKFSHSKESQKLYC